MIYQFQGNTPYVHESAYVHPTATVIGSVDIGKKVYIGPGAILRGDIGNIIIEDGSNVQENCIIHMFPGVTVHLEQDSHIGHGAIVHGAKIGANSLVGMNAVVMDNVVVGKECIIGALAFVKEGMIIPDRKIVVGNPAKILKDVSDELIQWKSEGTAIYQQFPEQYEKTLLEVKPLRIKPERRSAPKDYLNLKSR